MQFYLFLCFDNLIIESQHVLMHLLNVKPWITQSLLIFLKHLAFPSLTDLQRRTELPLAESLMVLA